MSRFERVKQWAAFSKTWHIYDAKWQNPFQSAKVEPFIFINLNIWKVIRRSLSVPDGFPSNVIWDPLRLFGAPCQSIWKVSRNNKMTKSLKYGMILSLFMGFIFSSILSLDTFSIHGICCFALCRVWTLLDWCWIRTLLSWAPQAQSEAWEVYPWKLYPPDDPPRASWSRPSFCKSFYLFFFFTLSSILNRWSQSFLREKTSQSTIHLMTPETMLSS